MLTVILNNQYMLHYIKPYYIFIIHRITHLDLISELISNVKVKHYDI